MQQIKKTPLFSVLIANYNNGQYLQECLDSVFAQTYKNWEIILVDDASTDGISHKIYEKYKDHPKIKIFFNKENKGCGYTKRRCVEKATGEICGFLDPDDLLTTNALEVMTISHLENESYSIIYSTFYACSKDLKEKKISNYSKKIPPNCTHLTHIGISHFATFKLINYKKTSGINPKIKRAVDQDLYLKLEETGPVLFINTPLYYYRQNPNGISTDKNELKAEFWNWYVRIDAAKRRNFNLEDTFAQYYRERFKRQKQQIKNTLDYKIGNTLLKPFRFIKKNLHV